MALFNPTFVFGVVVLLYLSSFIVFAVLRIITGISIQRIGYLSLRRLAYTLKDGIRIELRGLGINLHRPTFAQPTWVSVVLTELAITVDLNALEGDKDNDQSNGNLKDAEGPYCDFEPTPLPQRPGMSRRPSGSLSRSKSWDTLTKLKNRIKRLHRQIKWIRMVDVVATNTTLKVIDVGTVQLGSFTMAVDTRRKMVDRGRMFYHKNPEKTDQRPAEWMFAIRSVLFTPDGKESLEVLDHATLNIHGLLYKELDGLRDAAIALKLGRIHIPYDDILLCVNRYKGCRKLYQVKEKTAITTSLSIDEFTQNNDHPGAREDQIAQTVSDSKEFFSSILRGIKEVQFAVSFIAFTKRIHIVKPGSVSVWLNASMKEVGIDLHRLDPKSPAHRMYFGSKDIAHQALLAALAISIGVDDGHGHPERLVYIPMATTTIRTTLPSKTVEFTRDRSADERNANILYANIVITSPSIDLDPKHLPLALAIAKSEPKKKSHAPARRHVLISRLLPKSNIKFSMHEPVIRISLPPVEKNADPDDFDLIISSISSISLDVESSHSSGDLNYTLGSSLRIQTHDLYYQTSLGNKYELVQTEALDLKVSLTATPDVYVVASGNFQTFSIHMVRPEISDGVRQIVRQLKLNVEPDKRGKTKVSRDPNLMRALPPWLLHVQLQGSDFSAEVAGVDSDISNDTRGIALQLESWTSEYVAQRDIERKPSRRRTGSRSITPDIELLKSMPPTPRRKVHCPTDGRRLAVHVRGLEAFVIEAEDKWEAEALLGIPRFEVALSTSSDNQGLVFHVNSHVKTLLVQYSLYRHYAIGVAVMVLRNAFVQTKADRDEAAAAARAAAKKQADEYELLSPIASPRENEQDIFASKELVTIDFKASLLQVKAHMPSDPEIMIQIYGMEAGRHRWSPPFLRTKLARMYAETPRMKGVWSRIASVKGLRVDLKEGRRRLSTGGYDESKLIDVNSEAIRLAVPHQLVLHNVFDNIVNTIKASEQLHHRFSTGTNEYILEKHPEGPKNIPKISIRSKALLFELEDGAFEWKLGTIYRCGQIEQQQRLARQDAFEVKVRKIEEEERGKDPSRKRNRSAHPRGRSQHGATRKRSNSDEGYGNRRRGRSHSRGPKLRYDPEGTCGLSGRAKVTIDEALQKLQRYNSQSWKKRIDRTFGLTTHAMKDLRGVFWGPDELPDDLEETENILEIPQRPALMSTLIHDLHITVGKPSFPMAHLPEFLHKIGKGMPYDTQYSLLVPMNVQIDMGEARIRLRDYPLPLLHVPALKPGQSSRVPSWSLKTDFVIAEEFRGSQSTRHVRVDIVPPKDTRPGTSNAGSFAIDVRRTVSPVKSYSDISVDINTGLPTRITWGASYQPAIQDMMMVIESFTKPQVDPSERTGFWDKIRLSFHSRVSVAWRGDGDVHLMLKGTRDPYQVTGDGAGFLMCWRNDVRLNIWKDGDPKKFMTVDSGEYVLAIPDFSHQARAPRHADRDDASSVNSFRKGSNFKKVVMKLSGNVQWLAGLMFERDLGNGKRSFDFEPHYNVILKEPSFAKAPPGGEYDAFRGFRSHHIHMSIAVKAPVDRDWTLSNTAPSRSYNTVHLTPRFFTHFYAWWSMFGGAMSLPIRQGPLWPGIEKSSKKFGRHLATIKYNLLLAPLFLSHIYKHKDVEEYNDDVVSATGLKIRLDSFMLDMHQRREEFMTSDRGRKLQTKTTGMKMHQAQLDLLSADIRAISASIAGTTPEDLRKASAPTLVSQGDGGATDLSHFDIPDNDFTWIDMDDFVELDWILPSESNPETKIMPLAYAPRFTYFRQTDHGDTISGDPDRSSPFGGEPTHNCIMSRDDDPRRVQCQLIKDRLDQLIQQISDHKRHLGDVELAYLRDDGKDQLLKQDYEQLSQHDGVLRDKKLFLESMYHRMNRRVFTGEKRAVPDGDADRDPDGESASPKDDDSEAAGMDDPQAGDFISDFNNRFVIHNMQLKWNNSLRNILLRYIHQVSQRRGFVYYLSRRAVKFILDIVEEQNKAKEDKESKTKSEKTTPPQSSASQPSTPVDDFTRQHVTERINELLTDGKKFVSADDPLKKDGSGNNKATVDELGSNIAREFTPQNSYHLRLIAPQIQLQSEKNEKSVVLVTAKGMEAKVVEVMDKDRIFDDVSGLVQRRFSVEMDSTQFFVGHQKLFSSQLRTMYSGNRYGQATGSDWPPWVPMEIMFDFKADPFGFKRVVQRTSASLRYDKYNTLRLKYNDEITGSDSQPASPENIEKRMDHLWVEFPIVRAICDSSQYYAMYIIVLDLLLYSEPLEKTRNERLEKIMLASDFSDLRGAPEMVIRLQERIRQLDEIKTQFQINSKYLDKKGWEDRMALERDSTNCEDELFFMMKAITTSQRKYDGSQSNGLLRWNISSEQIVWHLMRDKEEPLMEFQLQNAEYNRTDNADGSHINLMQIGKIVGLNLMPDAIYPEMIAPYIDPERTAPKNKNMFRVYWNMLEAIAGIPVMDHFEVNLHPMKIQLEREVGKKLFEYVFPGQNDKESQSKDKEKHSSAARHLQVDEQDDHSQEYDYPEDMSIRPSSTHLTVADAIRDDPATTRAGSLELRLRPTMNSEAVRPKTAIAPKARASSMHSARSEGHHFRLFNKSDLNTSRPASVRTMNKKSSYDSLRSMKSTGAPHAGLNRTATNLTTATNTSNGDSKKRFGIRTGSKAAAESEKPSDDLTKMMNRASNYMTLAYVKIPSVVLCLSYKGRGERNIEDVHDFVFRMPLIEYRNKTWSNLDLALALKKDVIKALISHTGAIIGNKFSKHRPDRAQQSRLRELATSSMLLPPPSAHGSRDNISEVGSVYVTSPTDTMHSNSERSHNSERSRSPMRTSFTSSRPYTASLTRTPSAESSVHSVHSRRTFGLSANMTMTSASPPDDDHPGFAEFFEAREREKARSINGDMNEKSGFAAGIQRRFTGFANKIKEEKEERKGLGKILNLGDKH